MAIERIYMPEEVLTTVKIPLSEIETSLRNKHVLPSRLTEARVEGENLILFFSDESQSILQVEEPLLRVTEGPQRKRKPRKRRNRMKTRGWVVVSRFTNSKGQKCSIYKPFVEALKNDLNSEEQRKRVESILRSNRNKPSEESIQYFLDNTLEYLKTQGKNSQ
jgi:hypothetical protein